MTIALLRREIRALVFDQYGTVAPFLTAKEWEGSTHQFVTWWRALRELDERPALRTRAHARARSAGFRLA